MSLCFSMESLQTLPAATLSGSFNSNNEANTHRMAEPDENLDISQPDLSGAEFETLRFEFKWQDLQSVAKHVKQDGWQYTSFPSVLEKLPENITVNEKLKDILRWSVQKPNPATEVAPEAPEAASEQDTLPRSTPDDSNSVEEDAANQPASIYDGSDLPTTSTKVRVPKTSNLFTRLKRLRQDVAVKRAASVRHKEKMVANNIPSPEERIPQTSECISCFEEFPKPDLIHLECSHDYCKTCLHEVVVNAMKRESAFPPKCCLSEIPRKQILSCLDSCEREDYKDKAAEYSIPAGHRWYCPEPKCAKWIKPEKLHRERRTHQVCPHCKVNICSMCHGVAHPDDEDCPQDFGLESTLEIADSEGWRRCYSCRTMVELTAGCRHVTCSCKAEFCYVCNARWRTCNCTEADKERRLAQLRSQREQRTREQDEEDAAAEAEAEEVAEAIRQIEQMELEELARREEQERQRQLEEELALARLEEERLLEEIARREAELETERQLQRTLLTSSKEQCLAMMSTLMQIINFQHAALMSEHYSKELQVVEKKETNQEKHSGKVSKHFKWLEHNIKKRRQILEERQTQEQQALQSQAEEEEDDMFMQMQIYLKDKPNREAREKKMRDALQKKRSEQNEELSKRHEEERQKLENDVFYEREGLRKAASLRLDPVIKEYKASLEVLGQQIGNDREWFQVVSTRRIEMMKEHKKTVLGQIEAREEPEGLTEMLAASVEPILPTNDAYNQASSEPDRIFSLGPAPRNQPQQEDEDMYSHSHGGLASPTVHEAGPTDQISTLNRSDTVIHSIPGAYPTSCTKLNATRNTVPTRGPLQRFNDSARQQQRTTSERLSTSGTSMPNTSFLAPSLTIRTQPQPNYTSLQQLQPDYHLQQQKPQPNFLPLQESQTPLNPTNPWQTTTLQPFPAAPNDPQQLAPVSPIHHSRNQSSGTGSTRDSTRLSTASSISPPSSINSSVVTDTEILDSMAANIVTGTNNQPNKRGLFGSRFGRRSQMSEEEIRRRMVECAGDAR